MTKQDFLQFSEIWQGVHNAMAFGKVYDQNSIIFVFELLEDYPLSVIQQAVKAYAKQNSQAPQPSDIIKIITKGMGGERPSSDVAWAEIPKNGDMPAVLSEEMLKAWALVSELYLTDKIGARMAFRSEYDRLCDESVLFNKPVKWSFSHGTDKVFYQSVVEKAVSQGRLTQEKATGILNALPKPANGVISGLIAGNAPKQTQGLSNVAKSNITEIMRIYDETDARIEAQQKKAREDEINRRDAMIRDAMTHLSTEEQNALKSQNNAFFGIELNPSGVLH